MPREHAREFANVDINQRATGLAASRPRPKPLQRQHHRSEYQDAAAIMQQPHHQRQWLMQQRLAAEQAGANVGFPAAKSFRNKARYEVEAATAKLMQEPLLRRVEDAPAAAATVSRQALQQAEERALAAEERAKASDLARAEAEAALAVAAELARSRAAELARSQLTSSPKEGGKLAPTERAAARPSCPNCPYGNLRQLKDGRAGIYRGRCARCRAEKKLVGEDNNRCAPPEPTLKAKKAAAKAPAKAVAEQPLGNEDAQNGSSTPATTAALSESAARLLENAGGSMLLTSLWMDLRKHSRQATEGIKAKSWILAPPQSEQFHLTEPSFGVLTVSLAPRREERAARARVEAEPPKAVKGQPASGSSGETSSGGDRTRVGAAGFMPPGGNLPCRLGALEAYVFVPFLSGATDKLLRVKSRVVALEEALERLLRRQQRGAGGNGAGETRLPLGAPGGGLVDRVARLEQLLSSGEVTGLPLPSGPPTASALGANAVAEAPKEAWSSGPRTEVAELSQGEVAKWTAIAAARPLPQRITRVSQVLGVTQSTLLPVAVREAAAALGLEPEPGVGLIQQVARLEEELVLAGKGSALSA